MTTHVGCRTGYGATGRPETLIRVDTLIHFFHIVPFLKNRGAGVNKKKRYIRGEVNQASQSLLLSLQIPWYDWDLS